jgi:hypothetical protein
MKQGLIFIVEKLNDKFYSSFWTLQRYFSSPLSTLSDSNWDIFTKGFDNILREFESISAQTVELSSEKRKRDSQEKVDRKLTSAVIADLKEFFFPKYLTSRNLFNLQVNNFNTLLFKNIHNI